MRSHRTFINTQTMQEMRLKSKLLLLLAASVLPVVWAQEQAPEVLDYASYIAHVKEHHPQVYRSELITEQGRATVLKAQGAFDPKLDGNMRQKYYDGKVY